jgi:hypothetical protein
MHNSIFFKAIRFIGTYISKDPIFVFRYILAYPQNKYQTGAVFYENEDFLAQIVTGRSLIRIGDGEIGLLHGIDISYQKHSQDLESGLRRSIVEYTDNSPYILAIPVFVKTANSDLRKEYRKLNCWLPLKIEFNRIFNKSATYADAHFFYYKNNFEENLESYLKEKKIIINTTKENRETQKEDIENRFQVLAWVDSKSPEPYDLLEETIKEIDTRIEQYEGDKNDIVLILSSGPLSKILAYIYSKKGIQALDIGKGFEHIYNQNNFQHHI